MGDLHHTHLHLTSLPGQRLIHSGMTVVECLLALVILAIAILGLTGAANSGHQHQQHSERVLRAVRLAEHLLEEIQSRPYSGNGASRTSYHMDDFNNFEELSGDLKDFTSSLYGAADQRYSRTVSVTDSTLTLVALENAEIPGKTLMVTVQDASGAHWQLSRFIAEPVSP